MHDPTSTLGWNISANTAKQHVEPKNCRNILLAFLEYPVCKVDDLSFWVHRMVAGNHLGRAISIR